MAPHAAGLEPRALTIYPPRAQGYGLTLGASGSSAYGVIRMRCIGFKELRTIVGGVSRPTIERWSKLQVDPFPLRVQIGPCRVCWWLHEVLDWLERRSAR